MPSIKNNAIANYIGQGYIIILSIFITPFYINYMSTEAYGLIGFFALMQFWFNILDMGLSPTFGRQVPHAKNNEKGMESVKKLLHNIEFIFLFFSILTILFIFFKGDWVSQHWIQAEELTSTEITKSIILMAIIICIRWFSTLYKSGINGLEDQIWLNSLNVIIASLKYLGSLLLLIFISTNIGDFFIYQLLIYIIEVLILMYRFYSKISISINITKIIKFNFSATKTILPFALSIAYTTGLWTFIKQFDKLLLSNILSLNEFAYLSVITLLVGSVTILATPIFLAVMPRMVTFVSNKDDESLISLYITMSQIITWVTLSTIIILCIFSREILYIFIGDIEAATWGEEILFWYSIGTGMFVLGSLQYYLQNAYGNLKLYVIGSTIYSILQIPITYYITKNYGALGASQLWFLSSLLWFIIWTYYVHKKIIPAYNTKWFMSLIPIFLTSILFGIILNYLITINLDEHRVLILLKIALISILIFVLTAMSIERIRSFLLSKIIIKDKNNG
jgi:O-antigen/teichoic acid export membrane protein